MRVRGQTVRIEQGGAFLVQGRDVTLDQSGAFAVVGDTVNVSGDGSGMFIVIGRTRERRPAGARLAWRGGDPCRVLRSSPRAGTSLALVVTEDPGKGSDAREPGSATTPAEAGHRSLNVTIVAANPFEFDSRFLRTATTLAADGHRLRVLGWSAPGLPAEEDLAPGVPLTRLEIDRRHLARAPTAAGRRPRT